MSQLAIELNGKRHAVTASTGPPLLLVPRDDLCLHGLRFGCGLARCGACPVPLNEQDARSCVTPVASVTGKQVVTTIEGLGTISKASVVQRALIDAQAAQCRYCTSGVIIAATSLLKQIPHPTEDVIKLTISATVDT